MVAHHSAQTFVPLPVLTIKIISICTLILIFIHGSNAALDPNPLVYICPSGFDVLSPLSDIDSSPSANVVIELPIAEANKLCTLSSIENGIYIPFVSNKNHPVEIFVKKFTSSPIFSVFVLSN